MQGEIISLDFENSVERLSKESSGNISLQMLIVPKAFGKPVTMLWI